MLLTDERNQDIFPKKLGHFFPISEKGQGSPPPSLLPLLVTRLRLKFFLDGNFASLTQDLTFILDIYVANFISYHIFGWCD